MLPEPIPKLSGLLSGLGRAHRCPPDPTSPATVPLNTTISYRFAVAMTARILAFGSEVLMPALMLKFELGEKKFFNNLCTSGNFKRRV